jgi:hypothetical protein
VRIERLVELGVGQQATLWHAVDFVQVLAIARRAKPVENVYTRTLPVDALIAVRQQVLSASSLTYTKRGYCKRKLETRNVIFMLLIHRLRSGSMAKFEIVGPSSAVAAYEYSLLRLRQANISAALLS